MRRFSRLLTGVGLLLCTVSVHAQLVTNGTLNTDASGWSLGGGCGDEAWDGANGNPPGSIRLNACGESDSDPAAAQTINGLVVGATYTIKVDVQLHVDSSGGGTGKSFGIFLNSEPGVGRHVARPGGPAHDLRGSSASQAPGPPARLDSQQPTNSLVGAGVLDACTLLQLARLVVLFVFPGVTPARWQVETPQRKRQRQADQRRRQVRFPGDSSFDRQHAPDRRALEEGNQQRRGDGAPVPSYHSRYEDVADQPVDQSARADMDAAASE